MTCSCQAWFRQCKPRRRLRRQCRLSCRLRLRLQLPFLRSMAMVVLPSWRGESRCLVDLRTTYEKGVQRGVSAPVAAAAAALVTGRPGRPRAQARVFALAREDAEQAENVIEGTVLVMGVHARVLFDMGATHLFISEQFAKQLAVESGVEAEELEVPLSVHTPI
ncbi:hypothetical protein Taro_035223, partial [Colocasia esculenta]|nr:hypothetical protein [Colocasia esculenta]